MQGKRAQPRVGRGPYQGTYPLGIADFGLAPRAVTADQRVGIYPAIVSAGRPAPGNPFRVVPPAP